MEPPPFICVERPPFFSHAAFYPLFSDTGVLTSLLWEPPGTPAPPVDSYRLNRVHRWLGDYFQGRFRSPDFPLAPQGTPFQKRLWRRLEAILPGRTETYGDVARDIDSAPRAVGRGVAANPIPILIPCHRVGAAHGLGGYSGPGGVDAKGWLLRWEGWPGLSKLSGKQG